MEQPEGTQEHSTQISVFVWSNGWDLFIYYYIGRYANFCFLFVESCYLIKSYC
jgi:hypothetical protein